jgi:hypothetical protein
MVVTLQCNKGVKTSFHSDDSCVATHFFLKKKGPDKKGEKIVEGAYL